MRTRLLTLLVATLSSAHLASPSVAQVSLEMQPIESDSIITDITLYRNRASVTRTTTVELDAGGYAVFFRDLPETAFLDSVQARVSDNASLLSVDTSSRPIVKDNSELVAELTVEISLVEEKISLAKGETDAIELQIELLKTVLDKATNDKAPPLELTEFNEQISFVGKRMQELAVLKSTNAEEVSELNLLLRNLQHRKQLIATERKNQISAVVDIGVERACTVEIQLTYLVHSATWSPSYSVRANTTGDEITIDYDAILVQKTGENWTDVSLTLSTAQPQQSITPPMPTPWYVDVYQPPAPTSRGSDRSYASPSARFSADHDAFGQSYVTESAGVALPRMGKNIDVVNASASAAVVNDGPAVSFVLLRTVTIPSNASDEQKTSIASIQTTADHYLIAVPMLTDKVFIHSEVTNNSSYILLPGKASIFHGGDYVGKTSLSTISPDETFGLDLGIAPTVTTVRTLVEKTTSTTGLFNSGKQTLYEFQIAISNGESNTIDVRVYDRIPVSRNEEIEVHLKNLSIPLSQDPRYLRTERPQGILRWDLSIPANKTGESKYIITWDEEIARGNDIELTPLPE